jgi:uncharacterized membrane protein
VRHGFSWFRGGHHGAVTGFKGSWRFIILNLAFSTQAAYAAPLILLASNQSAVRDRATLEHSVDEAEAADKKDSEILARLGGIEAILAERAGSKS